MPVDTTREQFNVMLQNLLADRLGLKVHWTTQQIDMYALVPAKGGPKLKPAAPDTTQETDNFCGGASCKFGPDGFHPAARKSRMDGSRGGKQDGHAWAQ